MERGVANMEEQYLRLRESSCVNKLKIFLLQKLVL